MTLGMTPSLLIDPTGGRSYELAWCWKTNWQWKVNFFYLLWKGRWDTGKCNWCVWTSSSSLLECVPHVFLPSWFFFSLNVYRIVTKTVMLIPNCRKAPTFWRRWYPGGQSLSPFPKVCGIARGRFWRWSSFRCTPSPEWAIGPPTWYPWQDGHAYQVRLHVQ